MVVLLVAILSGALSVLTPCVLPLLPAILASSSGTGRRRPLGIVFGLVTSFTIALIAFSAAVRALDIPSGTLRWVAVVLLAVFGAVLLVPPLERAFERLAGTLTRIAPTSRRDGDGFWTGALVGAGLGLVWAPCVGPIIAGVAVASSTSTTTTEHVVRALGFAVGMSIPLLALTFGGQRAATALRSRVNPRRVQQVAGIVLIVTAGYIAAELDTKVNSWLAETTGISSTIIAGLEERVTERDAGAAAFEGASATAGEGDESQLPVIGTAPEPTGIVQWINTEREQPLTLAQLRGKVVLIDFWTYSCINCLRTLPYINGWHETYEDDGLVIIGVHAPEFEFEKDEQNVRKAVGDLGIEYPVALDNDFRTWGAYFNRYWPAKYLIDAEGRLRYTHFGEGDYAETEDHIRDLLADAGTLGDDGTVSERVDAEEDNLASTPETYLGHERAERRVHDVEDGERRDYGSRVPRLGPDEWALTGEWTVEGERSVAGKDAAITLRYRAADVFLVLGSTTGEPGTAQVTDTAPDGKDQRLMIDRQDLFTLRSTDEQRDETVTVKVSPGVAAYAFTFG